MWGRVLVTTLFVFFGTNVIYIRQRLERINHNKIGGINPKIRAVDTEGGLKDLEDSVVGWVDSGSG